MRQDWTTRTSSTPASTRLAVLASAASMRMRTPCPAYGVRLALATAQAPLRLAAAPTWLNRTVVPPLWTTEIRKKSADDEFEPWARYHDSDSVSVPVDGRLM